MDFDDLLIKCRDLLRDNEEIRKKCQDRFSYILVDEFQDTDELQAEIVYYLCERVHDSKHWNSESVDIVPGKLFIVGDPKQSIYRFRGADVDIFHTVKGKIGGAPWGRVVDIRTNFRTVAPIIDWVNGCFSNMPGYIPLEAVRDDELSPGKEVWVIDKPDALKKANINQIRTFEAEEISAQILHLVGNSTLGIRFRDIAILLPKMTNLHYYEDALQKCHIPYVVDGGKEFFTRQEVYNVLAVLKAICDPTDVISVVAALRSEFFGVSDSILASYHARGGRYDSIYSDDYKCTDPELCYPIEILRELHGALNKLTISELIDMLYSITKIIPVMINQPYGKQRAANYEKITRLAQDFWSRGGKTLSGFIEWLEDTAADDADEANSAVFSEDDDVVRMMTIHKSKGLEFKVVIAAELASDPNRMYKGDRFIYYKDKPPYSLEFKLGQGSTLFETKGWDDAAEWDKQKAKDEIARLMYVPTTRARDLLIIPNFGKKDNSNSTYFSYLKKNLPNARKINSISIELKQDHIEAAAASEQSESVTTVELLAGRNKWLSDMSVLISKATLGLKVRHPSEHGDENEFTNGDGSASESLSPSAGAVIGSAFHRAMELIDLRQIFTANGDYGSLVDSTVARACHELNALSHAGKVTGLVEKCLAHPLMAEVASAKEFYREIPFCCELNGDNGECELWEGKIDLIYVTEDGSVVVIDYKTDSVGADKIDKRFNIYKGQGTAYADAVRKIMPGALKMVAFLFVESGEVRII